MSYTKYYGGFSITTPNGIIPVIECGCSNTRMKVNGRWVADRNFTPHCILPMSKKDVENIPCQRREKMLEYYGEEYTDDSFGWFSAEAVGSKHTTATTFADYQKFWAKVVKLSFSFEELADVGCLFRLYVSPYNTKGLMPKTIYFQSFEGYVSALAEMGEYAPDGNFYFAVDGFTKETYKLLK